MRSKLDIEIDICMVENRVIEFKSYNRMTDARSEQEKLVSLLLELDEVTGHETAEALCYV